MRRDEGEGHGGESDRGQLVGAGAEGNVDQRPDQRPWKWGDGSGGWPGVWP